jgi:hypothetical protein
MVLCKITALITLAFKLSAWSAIQISPEFKIRERMVHAQHTMSALRLA